MNRPWFLAVFLLATACGTDAFDCFCPEQCPDFTDFHNFVEHVCAGDRDEALKRVEVDCDAQLAPRCSTQTQCGTCSCSPSKESCD